MIKCTSTTGNWQIVDNQRDNGQDSLKANSSDPEQDGVYTVTFTDTGFQIINNSTDTNRINAEFIYIAIAENATAAGFPNTGTLMADADTVNKTVNLSNTGGTWAATQTATGPVKSGVGNFVSTNGSTELTIDNSNNQWISNNNALSKDFFAKKAFSALNANDPAHVALQQAIVTAFANVKIKRIACSNR